MSVKEGIMKLFTNTSVSGSTMRPWLQAALLIFFALVYWVAVRSGLLLVAQPEGVASIWPASGLALAILLLHNKDKWPKLLAIIFITNAAGNWNGGNSIPVSLGFALANTLEAFIGALVMTRFNKSKITFGSTAEVLALFGVATICNGLTALVGAAVPLLAFGAPFMKTWMVWWAADGLGIILVTPAIISWNTNRNGRKNVSPQKLVGTVLLVLALFVFALLLFGPFTVAERPLLYSYMIFPLLIWLSFRFDLRGISSALLFVAVIAIFYTLQGSGIFGSTSSPVTENLISLQIFLLVATFSGLIINSIVNERKKSKEVLRENVERFQSIVEKSTAGYFFIDIDGYFRNVNKAWLDLHKYSSPEEILGRHFSVTQVETDISRAAEVIERVLTGDSIPAGEFMRRCKDGSIACHLFSINRVIQDRKVTGVEGFVIDITERKKIEEEKIQWERQREQLQKTESLGRMAGAIAHHFNNQLGVVIGNLELALIKLPKGASTEENLTSAMEASNNAARMSGLMLTYLGHSFDKCEPMDISYSCRKMLPVLKAALPENVIVETDFPSPGPVINTSPDYMEQILANLITNAREAVGNKNSGTIFLRVKTVSPAEIPTKNRFPIDWTPQDIAYACLEVTDTGRGIADKDMEKLFDPFFTDKFTGRGMGLPVVLGIVKTHKGVLTVESKPKQGSTFRVFFPLSEVALRQPQKAANKDDSLISAVSPIKFEEGGTVLVVEDEEPLRRMIATMLRRLGFTVLEAKDGVEALEVFGQHRNEIQFVLSDLTMPRMDGWETITALRKLQPGIPVILASGYDKAHVMSGNHSELPQAFLGKPYRLKELSDAISQVMGSKKVKAEG
jgi:PAS domain S-box-containing protein